MKLHSGESGDSAIIAVDGGAAAASVLHDHGVPTKVFPHVVQRSDGELAYRALVSTSAGSLVLLQVCSRNKFWVTFRTHRARALRLVQSGTIRERAGSCTTHVSRLRTRLNGPAPAPTKSGPTKLKVTPALYPT